MLSPVFDNAPSGYFSFFDDGRLHIFNKTFCSLLGYDQQDLTHCNVEKIFTLPTRIFYQTHFFPLVKMQGHAEEIFISLLSKTGQHIPVLLNAKREEDEKPIYTACSFIVVANRKKFEDELIAARKAAETALQQNTELQKAKAQLQTHAEELDAQIHLVNQQNVELNQLNHAITHSLKEPLRKILLYGDKLGTHPLPAGAAKDHLGLTNASRQMQHIITGLQQYIWLNDTPLNFSVCDLNQVIKNAADKLGDEIPPDQLLLKINSFLPATEADAEQLELLFYHIFSNAVKFKKENQAEVNISASVMKQNRFENIKGKYQYEDFVKIDIADNGIGFDETASETVFELFKKLHWGNGIGLGLSLCKKIAENHHGFIKAASKPGEGTVIILRLPLRQSYHQDKK